MSRKESVLGSVIITSAVMVAIIFVVYLFIALFSPITLAHMYNNINHNLSLKYYEKVYLKSKELDDLYNLVNKSIEFDNDDKLVKYYPILESHEDYDELIAYLDKTNYDANDTVESNLFRSKEENRLKSRYVSALVKSKPESAFKYAYDDMKNSGSRAEYNFISVGLTDDIDSVVEYMTPAYVTDLYSYYNYLKSEYNASKSGSDKFKQTLLCYRSLTACRYMILLDRCGVEMIDRASLNSDKASLTEEFNDLIAIGEE